MTRKKSPKSKASKGATSPKPGEELELLVARLETALAGTGATVTADDRVYDYAAKSYQQVDVTIRSTIGSVEILIIVECRDRGRTQGDSWLEELKSLRDHTHAHHAIAVSSSSFSARARNIAEYCGIELRTVGELDDAVVQEWLKVHSVSVLQPGFYMHQFTPVLAGGDPEELVNALTGLTQVDPAFRVPGIEEAQNVRQLFGLFAERGWNTSSFDPWAQIPKDGTRHRKTVQIQENPQNPVRVSWRGIDVALAGLELDVDLWMNKSEVPLARMVSYKKDREAFIEAAEYLATLGDIEAIILVHRDLRTPGYVVTAHALGGGTLPPMWMSYHDYPLDTAPGGENENGGG